MRILSRIANICSPSTEASQSGIPEWAVKANTRDDLPANWTSLEDSTTGRTYYLDHANKKTTWKHPLNKPYTPGVPAPWERAVDDVGRYYYLNHDTRTTQWNTPEGVKDEPPAWSESETVEVEVEKWAEPPDEKKGEKN